MVFRDAEIQLKQWYRSTQRKPMVLRGARQVGKSTLVRQFAAYNELTVAEINLERHLYLNAVFKTLDLGRIIYELEAVAEQKINTDHTILFLDEIQSTPYAIQALRYFYEDRPHLPVIGAGSLLEFALADHHFSMPVGRITYYHLGPLTFKEFLSAVSPGLVDYLTAFTLGDEIPLAAHKKLLNHQREYLFVGGMPEAVQIFVDEGSLTEVTEVQRSIADTYQDDFAKYAKQKDLVLLQQVFRTIPRGLGKKVKYSNIVREEPAIKVKNVIELLTKARICHQIFHSHCTGIPLFADINSNAYKLLFMDVGMANHICGNDWLFLESIGNRGLINEGGLAEQFVGQHLLHPRQAQHLCCWLREGKSSNAEVDYVISRGNLIVPIEVKGGKSGALKSLQQFVFRKRVGMAVRFDLNPPSVQNVQNVIRTKEGNREVKYTLISLPLYMAGELPRILDAWRGAQ
ncbi:Predicted ATPase (AAA+ superfamily) [Olavius algarvensis Delta 1 endosymbiont]|nr:Predicted ATPase (AAA+ superfamily) [Olavius algarvensis Delta 1 endosymbiont]